MFFVLVTVVALPDFGSIRGLLFLFLGLYLMFLVFINRGPIRWVHASWVIGFFLLTQLSIQWSIYPSGAKVVINNTTFALLLNWSFAEYMYQGKRSLRHICKITAVIAVFLGLNFLLNGSAAQDGRLSVGVNENVLGMSAAYLFGVLMYGAKKAKWRNWKINFLTVAVAMIAVLTGSRKALVMLVIFTAAYILLWVPEKDMRRFAVKVLGIVAICTVVIILLMEVDALYNTIGNRIETLYLQWFKGESADSSAITRERMINIGWKLIKRRPWFGYGHNGFKLASGYFTYSHNNYIELMCSVGVIGAALYYLPLAFFTIKAFVLWCRGIEGAIFPLVILAMQFLNDVGQVSYYSFSINIFLGIAIGYVYLLEEQNRPKRVKLSALSPSATPLDSPAVRTRRRRIGRLTFAVTERPVRKPAKKQTAPATERAVKNPAQKQAAPATERAARNPARKQAAPATERAAKNSARKQASPATERAARNPARKQASPATERAARNPAQKRTSPAAKKPTGQPAAGDGSTKSE
jgi:O-antigen ligase